MCEYEVNAINQVKSSTVHIFDISLNKYGCHITHTCSTTLLLKFTYRHHISTQTSHKI